MIIILILGAATGAILGFRHFKVWALTPLIVFTAAGVVANGVAIGLDSRNMMFGLLAAVVCPQIGYLMSFIGSLVTPQQSRPDRKSGFTIGSREQDLLLSNYKTHIHHPPLVQGLALKARPGPTGRGKRGDCSVCSRSKASCGVWPGCGILLVA